MNVPKLRFSEFSENYKKIKLKNMTKLITKGTTPRKYTDSGVNFIKVENLLDNQIKNINSYISYETHNNELKRSILKEYDILFSIAGALGRTAIVTKEELPANTNQACSIIRLDNLNDYNLYYLMERLHHFDIKSYINKCQSVGAQPNLSLEQVGNICINIPNKKEQDRVGRLIELVNKKIELQTKKIDALKLFKKGLLNSFFQNRQPNVTIENCISYGKAGGTPSSKNKDYYDGNIPFLSISDMTSQKKYILKTEKSISQQGIKNSSAWIVPKNSIILSMYASYGLIAINKIELATSQAMFSMIVNSKNNIEYIYYYLEFLYNNNYYDRLVSIGTQANLNTDKVKKIKIYLPDINSQNKISKILKLCDERIEYENKKEFELRKFKQGLMQNMFI